MFNLYFYYMVKFGSVFLLATHITQHSTWEIHKIHKLPLHNIFTKQKYQIHNIHDTT